MTTPQKQKKRKRSFDTYKGPSKKTWEGVVKSMKAKEAEEAKRFAGRKPFVDMDSDAPPLDGKSAADDPNMDWNQPVEQVQKRYEDFLASVEKDKADKGGETKAPRARRKSRSTK